MPCSAGAQRPRPASRRRDHGPPLRLHRRGGERSSSSAGPTSTRLDATGGRRCTSPPSSATRTWPESLIRSGAEVDRQTHDGMTPLHWAAQEGHAEVVRLLLAAGARVDHQDRRGRDPAASGGLAWSVRRRHAAAPGRCRPDLRSKAGQTARHEAESNRHAATARLLQEAPGRGGTGRAGHHEPPPSPGAATDEGQGSSGATRRRSPSPSGRLSHRWRLGEKPEVVTGIQARHASWFTDLAVDPNGEVFAVTTPEPTDRDPALGRPPGRGRGRLSHGGSPRALGHRPVPGRPVDRRRRLVGAGPPHRSSHGRDCLHGGGRRGNLLRAVRPHLPPARLGVLVPGRRACADRPDRGWRAGPGDRTGAERPQDAGPSIRGHARAHLWRSARMVGSPRPVRDLGDLPRGTRPKGWRGDDGALPPRDLGERWIASVDATATGDSAQPSPRRATRWASSPSCCSQTTRRWPAG